MAEPFPLYEKWGIAGIKNDFMNRDDQQMVNWYREVSEQIRRFRQQVRADQKLTIAMAPDGGFAARLLPVSDAAASAVAPSGRLLRHLVALKFEPEVTTAQRAEALAACDRLPEQVPGIFGYERGDNASRRGLSHDLQDAILFTFRTQADLDAYVAYPAHQAFSVKYRPWLDDLLVLDWWGEE